MGASPWHWHGQAEPGRVAELLHQGARRGRVGQMSHESAAKSRKWSGKSGNKL